MRKVMIASHGRTASGMKSTIELFLKEINIEWIDAYLGGPEENALQQLQTFVTSIGEEDEAYLFTDLSGGSVNQQAIAAVHAASQKKLIVITNVNIAIIMELLTSPEFKSIEEINDMVAEQKMMPYAINLADLFATQIEPDDDGFLD